MPTLYLIAGCNGCGKTTFIRLPEYLQRVAQFDPDVQFAALGSWREVTKRLGAILVSKTDLVLEATLSGKTILKRIAQAKADGYGLQLTFIGTEHPAINIARIAVRRSLGGHDISDVDVRRRWRTSLANLPPVMERADSVLILDNSHPQENSSGAFIEVVRIQGEKAALRRAA